MLRGTNKKYIYSLAFKQMVVSEYEKEGVSLSFLKRKYGINGSATIQKWIKLLGKNKLLNKVVRVEKVGERDRLKELEKENKRLKEALGAEHIKTIALESLVEAANEHYNTDLKKNFGTEE